MKIVYLGTSAAAPTPERSLTCICLVRENEVLMFDAGEGAQVAYLKAGLPWNKKKKNSFEKNKRGRFFNKRTNRKN